MAYFNFDRAMGRNNMTPMDVLVLQLIHQNESRDEDMTDYIATYITDEFKDRIFEEGLARNLKNKKLNEIERIRLTKKGRNLLNKLQERGKFLKEDEVIADWMVKVYEKRPNTVRTNKTELTRRIQWFREETNIRKNYLASLIQNFLNDTFQEDPHSRKNFEDQLKEFKENNPRAVLSLKAENVLWSPPNRYARYYQLEDSPLYNYYKDNIEYIENIWKNL